MTPLAIFGITNDTLNTVVQLLLLVLVVVWLALIFYTYADARRRIGDPLLVACATAASLFPFVGTVIYMIVRPPEFLEDVRERDLEMQATELAMASAQYHPCPHCDYPVGRDFLRCPSCLRKLRDQCGTCTKPLDPDWRICPYCEADIPGITPERRRRSGSSGSSTRTGRTGEAEALPAATAAPSGSRRRRRRAEDSEAATEVEAAPTSSSRRRRGSDGTEEPAPAADAPSGNVRRRTGTTQNTEALKADDVLSPRRPRRSPSGDDAV
jgi:hypothetical protein